MTHFHRINSSDDEQDLLSKIISLETQIRAKNEKERLLATGQNETLGKIFEPITRELVKLSEITAAGATSQVPQFPPPRTLPLTPLDVRPLPTQPPSNPYLTPGTPRSEPKAPGLWRERPKPYPTPVTPRSKLPAPELSAPRSKSTAPGLQSKNARATPLPLPPTSYERALELVKNTRFSDGVLGLNPKTGRIQDKTFSVHGDSFTVTDADNNQKSFTVTNPYTWVYLLAKNPSQIVDTPSDAPAVTEYRNIAQKLGLVENLTKINVKKGYKKRNKYKLITAKTGKGFLFTTIPPPMLRKGNGMTFLPSDKQGIIRELMVAIAEYEAGNKSLRNIIVPLFQQAKRQKILPKTLEKTLKKFNWVYV